MMKKFAFAVSAFVVSATLASAFEWGGKLSNTTSFSDNSIKSLKLEQTDNLNLWIKVPLSKDNSSYFISEAFYEFDYDETDSDPQPITNTLDLNLFKFVINKKFAGNNRISIGAGRFGVSDATYMIFSQVCDGLMFKYSNNKFNATAYGGYTGLLNANSITLINKEGTNWQMAENGIYRLSAKYVPAGLSFSFPSLFANQTLSVQGWAFFDLNNDNYNRYYGTLSLNGYILKNLFYALNSSFGTVNFETISNLSVLTLTGYFTRTFSMNLSGTYASGNQGKLAAFAGFTSMTATLAFDEPQYSSMMKFDLSATKIFGKSAYLKGGTAAVFDMNESGCTFNGIQLNVSTMYNLFTDLQIGASFGQYFDLKNDDASNNKTQIALKAVVVF